MLKYDALNVNGNQNPGQYGCVAAKLLGTRLTREAVVPVVEKFGKIPNAPRVINGARI